MKKIFSLLCVCIVLNVSAQNNLRLWYKKPASNWLEALPIGNGRLGAMIYGGTDKETIQLNEESLFAGSNFDDNNPQAGTHIGEIQQLLLNGESNKAHELADKYLLATPSRIRSYQTLGNVVFDLPDFKSIQNYTRELDLNNAIAKVQFTSEDVIYTREVFASAPDNCVIIHIAANKPGAITFKTNLYRELDANVNPLNDSTLLMNGQIVDLPEKEHGKGGAHMKFNTLLKARAKGGTIKASGNSLLVTSADEVTLFLTAATDYNIEKLNFDRSIDAKKKCESIITTASQYNYETLLNRHENEYCSKFQNVRLNLGDSDLSNLPTNERLDNLKKSQDDHGLIALYFQYGRYLLLSSSRAPGILPANLQGIWNNQYDAPWNSDFHTNINLQMNYWLAGVTNIAETEIPLINFVNALRTPGRITAQKMYNAKGWTIHHNTDAFGKSAPHDGIRSSISPLAGAWLCLNLWDHYQFTGDKEYLKSTIYPIMKEFAQFVQSFLIPDKQGRLVTAPSMSPENTFILPNGQRDEITYAPTIDIELINALYNACLTAGRLLKDDPSFLKGLEATLTKLPPIQVSKKFGTIQEWIEDYDETEPGHRHISQLVGLHPANIINPNTPALFEAARKTLERRLQNGGGHTGWSRAWIINFYARLLDGETAWKNVQALLTKSTLTNLFDTHPPFQIDGNFGGTAGIAEMLLQSQNGYIELLPAIPNEWKNGSYSGLVARGAYEVSVEWSNGKITKASLFSKKGGDCIVKYGSKTLKLQTKQGKRYDLRSIQ